MKTPSTLREQIAQLIFPRIGSNMRPAVPVGDDVARIRDLLSRHALGGLCLFNGDRFKTPQDLGVLQSAAPYPLLVATDMERGVGQQLRGATVFPHAMAFSQLDPEDVETMARISAREALAAGIHISFSPVADVASNPKNPIISTRAYGTTTEEVIPRIEAYLHGCAAEGLLATAKHFPGHGDTETDSHDGTPEVLRDRDALDALELPPFRSAIDAGVPLVMTAHVAYPALDATETIATGSAPILQGLLRDEMHFKGAVISDSLLMEGAGDNPASPGEHAARLLKAGLDILLDIKDVDAVVEHLVTAAHSDAVLRSRIEEAFARVWKLKKHFLDRFGETFFLDPGTVFEPGLIGRYEHVETARDMASRALMERPTEGVPHRFRTLQPGLRDVMCILVRPHTTYNDPTASPLRESFLKQFPDGTYAEVLPETDEETYGALLNEAGEHRGVVVAVIVKPAAWHKFGLLPAQHRFVGDMCRTQQVVLASLGSPVVLDDFPDAAHALCLFSDVAASQQALVAYLEGLA